jgi:uncharacterized protein
MNWENKKVLVTGGGSGIGREIVKLLYSKGAYVVVATLLQSELDSLQEELAAAHGGFLPIQLDLTSDGAIDALMTAIESKGLHLDVLINNAGIALFGNHIDLDPNRVRSLLNLNVGVLSELSAEVARRMIAKNIAGSILNVASVGAYMPTPKFAAYSASKHYVRGFSHALAEELAPYGIHVGVLCPGITRTPILESIGLASGNAAKGSVSKFADVYGMNADVVAECAVRAIEKRKRVAIPGTNKAIRLVGLMPDWLIARAISLLIRNRPAK